MDNKENQSHKEHESVIKQFMNFGYQRQEITAAIELVIDKKDMNEILSSIEAIQELVDHGCTINEAQQALNISTNHNDIV